MRTFRDSEGREWSVAVNIAAVRRVRDLAQLDLLATADGRLLHELAVDPMKLADVLWAIVQPQAQQRDVSPEQFGQALAGETIDRATAALIDELVDFFPAHRRGPMRAARAKLATLLDKAAAAAVATIEQVDVEAMLDLTHPAPGTTSTSSPASSASTPPA
jgi:hypothetical protein